MQRSIFEPEHEEFRSAVATFCDRTAAPNLEKAIEQRVFDRDVWRQAGEQGFLGLEVPEEFGGSQADDYRFNMVFAEELAKVSMGLNSSMQIHFDICAPYLVDLGTTELKTRLLPDFAAGEKVAGIGMTEAGGGTDLAALKTTAVPDGDNWIINGSKTFITNGYTGEIIIVAARTSPEKGARGISLRATGAWELSALWEAWQSGGIDAVHAALAATDIPLDAGGNPASGPRTGVAESGGRRRVLVHASGYQQSPYADTRPPGEALTSRKLWHASPGSPGW